MSLTIGFPGACANIFWQLGVVKAIQQTVGTSTRTYTYRYNVYGVSAGAISSVFLVCGVCIDRAVERAFELSHMFDLSTRTFGVIGIWGYIVRIWLDEILPNDCANICSGKCTIFLQSIPPTRPFPFPFSQPTPISAFQSKADIIDAIMASCHLPILLDLAPFAQFRNKWYVDGQLLGDPVSALQKNTLVGGTCRVFRYENDHAYMTFVRGMKFMQFRDKRTAFQMIEYGYVYGLAQIQLDEKFDFNFIV